MEGSSGGGRQACFFFSLTSIACTVTGLLALAAASPDMMTSVAWLGSVRPSREDSGALVERATPSHELEGDHGMLLDFLATSPFARLAVTDLLIREWVGEDPPEVSRAEKLDDAIEAIQIMVRRCRQEPARRRIFASH